VATLTPGQHFRQSSAPRSPTPASRHRLGRSRLRPFGLPYGAAMISPAVEPCFCGRLGNARGATDSCTKMLRAWGVSQPCFSRPGISCDVHCGRTGAQDLSRKCCAGLNPPLRGDPQGQTEDRLAVLNVTHTAPVCSQASLTSTFVRCTSVTLFACAMLQTHSALLAEKVFIPNLNASVSSSASASFI